jgi:putative transposase
VRKTSTYQLLPTPKQERSWETVLWRCRERYTAGLQERTAAGETCGVSVTVAMQSAHLPGINAVRPDDRDRNAQVVQDVLHRLDTPLQAFVRRLKASATPGYPRVQSRTRSNRVPAPHVGEHGGAVLDGRARSVSTMGRIPIRIPIRISIRIPIRMHRPLAGTPQIVTISNEADGWHAGLSCRPLVPASRVPRCRLSRCP